VIAEAVAFLGAGPVLAQPATIRYVTSAEQVGSGGPIRTLGPGESDLRQLTWMPSSEDLAVLERKFDRSESRWYKYDMRSGKRVLLWGNGGPPGLVELAWPSVKTDAGNTSDSAMPSAPARVAGILRRGGLRHLVLLNSATGLVTDTLSTATRLSFPVWMPGGEEVACLSLYEGGQELQMPCGTSGPSWAKQVYGPYAFSHNGENLYYAKPNDRGRLNV